MSAWGRSSAVRAEQRRFRRAQQGKTWFVPDLPQFYYLTNFKDFLEAVHADHFECLGSDELSFLKDFQSLSRDAQCTYVRMANRRGYIFDRDKFSYSEIKDIDTQLVRLTDTGFAEPITPPLFCDWLYCLPKADLVTLLADTVCESLFKKSWKKAALVDVALSHIDPDDAFIPDRFFAQGKRDVISYLYFLHFGRIETNLQAFTLRDLGLVKQAEPDRRDVRRFDSREEAQSAYFYAKALHDFKNGSDQDALDLIEGASEWPEPQTVRASLDHGKLLQKLGGWSERRGEVETALSLYDRTDTPHCNERVVRLRWHRNEDDDRSWVETRLEEMIENPASDGELHFAQDFYARKFNKKRTSDATDLLRAAQTLMLDEAYRNQPERATLRHYKEKGIEAYRTENVPWRNLFGLLFWDLLFDGTTSPRRLPPKLRAGVFYSEAKDAIETRLARLDTPSDVLLDLLKTLSTHFGEDQAIVHWGSRSLDRIQALLTRSPAGAVAHMLRLMAQDWTGTKDGFPDLMLLEDSEIRFVEIKAVGDSLRRNQLTRLRQLKAAGYRCDVVKVRWDIDPDQPYVVVDVETTGGRPGLHRVTEVGAVKLIGDEIVGEFQSLVNPQRSIPANITRITGISNEMVANAPLFGEIAERFREFMGDSIFAAHNVNFDYGFISAEYEMIDQRFRHPKICTCASMRRLYPGHRSYSLKNLCKEYEISLKTHHRALCDAKAAAELLRLINAKRIAA